MPCVAIVGARSNSKSSNGNTRKRSPEARQISRLTYDEGKELQDCWLLRATSAFANACRCGIQGETPTSGTPCYTESTSIPLNKMPNAASVSPPDFSSACRALNSGKPMAMISARAAGSTSIDPWSPVGLSDRLDVLRFLAPDPDLDRGGSSSTAAAGEELMPRRRETASSTLPLTSTRTFCTLSSEKPMPTSCATSAGSNPLPRGSSSTPKAPAPAPKPLSGAKLKALVAPKAGVPPKRASNCGASAKPPPLGSRDVLSRRSSFFGFLSLLSFFPTSKLPPPSAPHPAAAAAPSPPAPPAPKSAGADVLGPVAGAAQKFAEVGPAPPVPTMPPQASPGAWDGGGAAGRTPGPPAAQASAARGGGAAIVAVAPEVRWIRPCSAHASANCFSNSAKRSFHAAVAFCTSASRSISETSIRCFSSLYSFSRSCSLCISTSTSMRNLRASAFASSNNCPTSSSSSSPPKSLRCCRSARNWSMTTWSSATFFRSLCAKRRSWSNSLASLSKSCWCCSRCSRNACSALARKAATSRSRASSAWRRRCS
mmetsp:Transcript_139019/g.443560  ORF Transcript_139019/g.443560 Transcript_139019/m.443560 type:complete len:542 (-) Transcript_139019:159-1784(-)